MLILSSELDVIIMNKSLNLFSLMLAALSLFTLNAQEKLNQDTFPDGSVIGEWYGDKIVPELPASQYLITNFGAVGDGVTLNTSVIQTAIDRASAEGGGVVVVPQGSFLTGALFFKPGTHLYLMENAVLKGSDNILDFPKLPSRMEGQNLDYFAAVVNANGVNGFTISGKGTLDGNGLKYWKAFWQRRKENSQCTNLEVSRPRLVFIQNSNDVHIDGVKLINSGFWTTHLYKCERVKLTNLHIFSPYEPVKAPSTDAIDVDVCSQVLIDGCFMSVNDDAIALKGGKGTFADKDPNNGINQNILIQNCKFVKSHGALTCGSEAIHNKNILFRNSTVDGTDRVLWLKNRPDTPQLYEYITVRNISGNATRFLFAKPWKQFYNLENGAKQPLSESRHVRMEDIHIKCNVLCEIDVTEADILTDFTFKNIVAETKKAQIDKSMFNGVIIDKVLVK